MRDHQPQPIANFNGLWVRGDYDSCPPDHFTDCANVTYSESSVQGRLPFINSYGLGVRALRQQIYTANVAGTQTIFLMTLDENSTFYSQQLSPVLSAPVNLSAGPLAGNPIDFQLVNFNGRAYITFSNATTGLVGQSCYFYDGTTFRVTGLARPGAGTTSFLPVAGGGNIDAGNHQYAIAFESDTGFISQITYFQTSAPNATGGSLNFIAIALGPAGTVARRLYMSKAYSGFIPLGGVRVYYFQRIADNVTTTLTSVGASDNQLLENDTYLFTILSNLPSGVGIGKYHNRLMIWGLPTQTLFIRNDAPSPNTILNLNVTPSTILFSLPNDPETIDTLFNVAIIDANSSGLIKDVSGAWSSVGVTACQEYRDMCYVFKLTKTYALRDNGDVPATWVPTVVDEGSGAFIKGVATVLDSNGVSYDYLVIANNTGIFTFNGLFVRPELTYKIADLWKTLNKIPALSGNNLDSGKVHIVLDTINKQLYVMAQFGQQYINKSLENNILLCDFANSFIGDTAFSHKAKWSIWTFNDPIYVDNTVAAAVPVTDDFIPVSLTGWDTGNQFALILNNRFNKNNYSYGGNSGIVPNIATAYKTENIPGPFFQSSLIGDDEGNHIHLAGIRYRVNINPITPNFAANPALALYYGFSNSPVAFPSAGLEVPAKLHTKIVNQDLVLSKNLADILITIKMNKNPFLLSNWISQRFMIRTSFDANIYFNINQVTLFIKPIYTQGRG